MSNDWGKPLTPEEVAKLMNKDWGNPVVIEHRAELVPQTPAKLTDTPEELTAKGWVQTAHDEWEKIAPDTSPFAGSKVTLTYVDEGHIPAWTPTPVNSVGSYYAPDGTLMNADGTRSIFDDVDAPDDDNPTCYAWHPESGCGIIFSDRDALNEALEAEPLLVEMTKEEYDNASKIAAADWGSEPAFVGGTITGRKDWSIPDINGDEWPTPEPVKPQSELTRALNTIMAPGFGEPEPRTAPVDTFSEADGPWYVVYFGPVLYTVLAGPYDTQEAAEDRIPIVWGQFEHDAAYDFSFPQRERSGLRATTVRSVFNLKGAYGKQ